MVGNNEHAFFNDTSSAPTNMVCVRPVIAYGQVTNSGSTQADAEQAFIQPLLPDDECIHTHIPQDIIDGHPDLKASIVGVHDPVFRLRRPLYGWSRSGNIWENTYQTNYGKSSLEQINGNLLKLGLKLFGK